MEEFAGTSTSNVFSTTWVSLTSLSFDILIVLAGFGLLVFYTFYFGKGRTIALILSLYAGALLYTFFPYIDEISFFPNLSTSAAWSKMLLFAGLVVVSALIIGRLTSAEFSTSMLYGWFEGLLLSALAATLLLTLSYHVLPVSEVYDFNVYLDKLFEPAEYLFFWLAAPLLGLVFLSNR